MTVINAFKTIVRKALPQKEGVGGQGYLDNLSALQIGHGSVSMKVNKNGLGLGGKNPQTSPFYVDMNGNVVASSINLGGAYIPTGGAANDVNISAVKVLGTQIVSLSITSTQIADDSISTPKLQANSIQANNIATNAVTAGKIAANAVEADKIAANAVTAGKIAANAISANEIQAGAVTAGKISVSSLAAITGDLGTLTAGVINASLVTITNLSASSIVTGTLTVGGSSAAAAILLRRDNGVNNGNTFLRWEGGTRIWADSSNRLGVNSIGSPMFIYVDSSERIIIPNSGQTTIRGGVFADGNVNVNNGTLRINSGDLVWYDSKLESGKDRYVFKDSGGTERVSIKPNGSNSELRMNGFNLRLTSNKTAIVPTAQGYRALYCIESPEVWFMDFVTGERDLESCDPIFLEVTEGKAHFIYCGDEDGESVFQVWRRRKDHAQHRFEQKTVEEFVKNERFLRQAK
jgi:hypothetical protein